MFSLNLTITIHTLFIAVFFQIIAKWNCVLVIENLIGYKVLNVDVKLILISTKIKFVREIKEVKYFMLVTAFCYMMYIIWYVCNILI